MHVRRVYKIESLELFLKLKINLSYRKKISFANLLANIKMEKNLEADRIAISWTAEESGTALVLGLVQGL